MSNHKISDILNTDRCVYYPTENIWRDKKIKPNLQNADWEQYWQKQSIVSRLKERLFSLFRKYFIARLVGRFCDTYFPYEGVILEAGSGTAESSKNIPKRRRSFMAADFSDSALAKIKNKNIDIKLLADIFDLPIRNGSISGLYNIGVMEHFTFKENVILLNEFKRILIPNGRIIFFWPWKYSWIALLHEVLPMFPPSHSTFGTFKLNNLIDSVGGLRLIEEKISVSDTFIHKIIVLECTKGLNYKNGE